MLPVANGNECKSTRGMKICISATWLFQVMDFSRRKRAKGHSLRLDRLLAVASPPRGRVQHTPSVIIRYLPIYSVPITSWSWTGQQSTYVMYEMLPSSRGRHVFFPGRKKGDWHNYAQNESIQYSKTKITHSDNQFYHIMLETPKSKNVLRIIIRTSSSFKTYI